MSARTFALVALIVLGVGVASFMFGSAFTMAELINVRRDLPKSQNEAQDHERMYVAVVIPDDLMKDGSEENYQMAMNMLLRKEEQFFKYVSLEKRLKHHIFIFQPNPKK